MYHTRTMRKEFFSLYGRLSPESKQYLLRSIYFALTDDSSAAETQPCNTGSILFATEEGVTLDNGE